MVADHTWKFNPPWDLETTDPNTWKFVSVPTNPLPKLRWTLEQLQEYHALLKAIKELEDQIGCPCPADRGKPDYLAMIRERLETEQKLAKKREGCKCEQCQCGK